jgi:alkylation response protein AidB-like acyl-CoA dehydrogenase
VVAGDSPEEAAFRAAARAWLAVHVEPHGASVDLDGGSIVFADVGDTARIERGRAWQRELRAGGWAGLGWPIEHGGRALPLPFRAVWAEESSAAPAPINLLGETVVGPAILAHGTAEQQRRFLAPILGAEELWCQLFSEAGAGSDLAAVTTTARRDGGAGWVVSGHKTWTSGAHYADYALLLARTDWDVPKHEGCTCFLLDMHQPGITVRPVRQMTGGAAFDEVVLEGARIAEGLRLGPEGGGWAVAMTALAHERLNLGLGIARAGAGVDALLADLRTRAVAGDPHVRQLAAQLVIEARCAGYLGRRLLTTSPGPDAALAKLASGRVSRRYAELAEAMRGAGAMVRDEYTRQDLWAPATRIAGGTDEILKTVIAERVLGLPAEPRTDKAVPFRDVRRGS